ncbi:hypothetical protein [Dactylosporangium sp. CA-092794]|uniref:hypothetical protein n=1 Tax=Dactylosporangium sp. CA-092794 TaxID=3239929 RepID=UPI003D8F49E5
MRQRVMIGIGCALAAVGLFLAYLRMARAVPVNADGASNALQAWDIFHGNPLLRGWALSDVSFYPTELIQYGMVQWVTGITADQIHITAAITYTMIVFLAAVLAKGRATGLEAWLRVGVAVTILLLPAPGIGYVTLLSNPNHTGSAVPLLLAWLTVDRLRHRVWAPILVAVLLGWGAMGDVLVTFVGAVPLIAVCAYRAVRSRGPELRHELALALAGVVSVAISRGSRLLLDRLGAYQFPHPPVELSKVSDWPDRAYTTAHMAGIIFGAHSPGWQPPVVEQGLAVLHVIGALVAVAAFVVTLVRAVRGTADRVDTILIAAIAADLGAEVVSTLSSDLYAAREISPVLPMSAVLAARLAGPWLAAGGARRLRRIGRGVLAGVLAIFVVGLVAYTPPRAPAAEAQEVADFLRARNLSYGLGTYWVSNNITVTTGRRVTVVPVAGNGQGLGPYCWQAERSMYDAKAHDARFVVFEKKRTIYGSPEQAVHVWGQPVERQDVGDFAILVYNVNLLDGFPPLC